jgi:hypothetical protein
MLNTATRAYTEAELDTYSERMPSGSISVVMIAILAVTVGGLSTLGVFAVHWLYAWLTSGTAGWTFPLIVGGAAAALIAAGLWFTSSDDDDWTKQPPEQATDVTATADAAWSTDNDTLDTVLVFRVEPDRYLLITENAWTPPLQEDTASDSEADVIPSSIRLVLMGEGKFRVAIDTSLSGPTIPLAHVDAPASDSDPDESDDAPVADGLYTTAELPPRIRSAIGLA